MTTNKYYAWACDFQNNTGEGLLAREFLFFFLKKNKIRDVKIETPHACFKFKKNTFKKYKKKFFLKNSFYYKYITPFVGIYKTYLNSYFLGRKTVYINFLPIWNFILFLIIPNKTIFGPITGSDHYMSINNFNNNVRKYFFPFFNLISKSIIKNKNNLIFSTNLVNYNFSNAIKNFQLIYFINRKVLKKKTNKKVDYLFYYRNHPNKNQKNFFLFLKIMRENGKIIKICGDKLNDFGSDNLGFLNKKKLNKLLSETKFVIASNENPISFFVQQAILNNVYVIFDKQNKNLVKKYYENYNLFNFSSINNLNYKKIKFNTLKLKKNTFKKKILANLSKKLF